MDTFAIGLFLAIAVKAVLDRIAEPLRTKFPTLDLWYFDWLALVLGGVVAWFAELDLFVAYVPDKALLTRLLTAFVIGGGAKLLNDVFSNAPTLGRMTYMRDTDSVQSTPRGRPRGW